MAPTRPRPRLRTSLAEVNRILKHVLPDGTEDELDPVDWSKDAEDPKVRGRDVIDVLLDRKEREEGEHSEEARSIVVDREVTFPGPSGDQTFPGVRSRGVVTRGVVVDMAEYRNRDPRGGRR